MQERGVRRIDADLERLQPVAADQALECEGVAIRRHKTVDFRKRRRLPFAEIRPENAALLDHRIGPLGDVLPQHGTLRLPPCFHTLPCDTAQPPSKSPPQPPTL